jgi:hypothetical protein
MATNSYLTSTLLAKEAAAQLAVASTFPMTGNKKYQSLWTQNYFTKGNTINVPLDNRYVVQRGDTISASDIVDREIPMTVLPLFSQAINVKPTDYQRSIRDFGEMFLKPAATTIAATMNGTIAAGALTTGYITSGVVGTPINTFAALRNARADMLKFAMPKRQRWMSALTLDDSAALQNSLNNQFNLEINSPILNDAMLGRLAAFDIFEDQGIQKHAGYTGAIGTPVLAADVVDGATTISLTGLTTGITDIIVAGAKIEFVDAYAVDGVYHKPINKKFQVVATANATSSGGGTATVSISPTVETTSTDALRNCSGITDTTKITSGTAVTISQNYNANICYTDMGLYCAIPPLQPFGYAKSSTFTDPNSGISCRVSITSDILNNLDLVRMDCQLAFAWNPEQMLVLMS